MEIPTKPIMEIRKRKNRIKIVYPDDGTAWCEYGRLFSQVIQDANNASKVKEILDAIKTGL